MKTTMTATAERRRQERRCTLSQIRLEFQNFRGERVQAEGTLEDCSDASLGIYMKRRMEVGMPVTLVQEGGNRVGLVRRCVRTNAGYFIGIEL